jgi:hypothetical protein
MLLWYGHSELKVKLFLPAEGVYLRPEMLAFTLRGLNWREPEPNVLFVNLRPIAR